jgi:hypothetical protein
VKQLISALLLWILGAQGFCFAAEEHGDLVAYALAANADSNKRLSSLSYDVKVDYEISVGDPLRTRTTASVSQQADLRRCVMERTIENVKAGTSEKIGASLLVGTEFSYLWIVDNPYAYRFGHRSVAEATEYEKEQIGTYFPPDPLNFAFGTGMWLLEDVRKHLAAGKFKATAIDRKDTDGSFIDVTVTQVDPPALTVELTIDVDRGCLVRRTRVLNKQGKIIRTADIISAYSKEADMWYPESIVEQMYIGGKKDANTESDRKVKIVLSNVKIGDVFQPNAFKVSSLALPDRVIMLVGAEAGTQGEPKPMFKWKDEYLPQSAIEELKKLDRAVPAKAH